MKQQHTSRTRFLQVAGGIIAISALLALAWLTASAIYAAFSGASDNVKAASIAAMASVATFWLGRNIEHSREIRQKVNLEKIHVYEKFFDIYFGLFSGAKPGGTPVQESVLIQRMLQFQKELILWGPNDVVSHYLDFKDHLTGFDPNSAQPERDSAAMIKSAALLLRAMRRDVGYRFTNFGPLSLARLQLADPRSDPAIAEVMNRLR